MDAKWSKKIIHGFVPFASGSEKYLHTKIDPELPGPVSYLSIDITPKKNIFKNTAAFGSSQSKSPSTKQLFSPGPGSYDKQYPWLRPVMPPLIRNKLSYNSVPSIPHASPEFVRSEPSEKSEPTKIIPKEVVSPTGVGYTFSKAKRDVLIKAGGNSLGPGAYTRNLVEKNTNGVTFTRSLKKYELMHEICPRSYYSEEHFSAFTVKKVPRSLQNFGNRCERFRYQDKEGIGPGSYNAELTIKNNPVVMPFGSSDARFRYPHKEWS